MLASSSHASSAEQVRAVLLCQVGSIVCALPLEHVSETMRSLPVEPISDTASFIDGMAIIRGAPVPVVDLARLLGNGSDGRRTRLVLVKIGARRAALSVGQVIGVRSLVSSTLSDLPPLLAGARAELVTAVGSLDAHLLLLLETSKVLPESSWARLGAGGAQGG